MKIVFDGLIYYLQKQGGISRYFDELIKGFSETDGCEVTVLLRKNEINKKFNDKVKVAIIDSEICNDNKIKKYLSVFNDKKAVNKYLKNNDLGDLVFHYSYYSFYRNLKSKTVLTVHDLVHEKFPNYFGGLINKVYLFNKSKTIIAADKIIAISEQTKKDLIETYKIDASKIAVIHHGLSDDFRSLSESDKSEFKARYQITKPYFLFVGNRELYKNFIFLLETFSGWSLKNSYDLYCIGGGDFNRTENDLMAMLGLKDSVKLFQGVSEKDLIGFYNSSNGLIYPSLYEGFGFPLLEAMACGVPALVSDIDIFREVGGGGPLYFSPADKASLIKALDASLMLNENRIEIGTKIAKGFLWGDTIAKTLEVYKK